MPNVGDVLAGLRGVKYFTSLDLVRGYYQMPVEERSREYTAFSTPHGHWQFKRLPFGLKNAPSAFQREMQEVLRGFSWKKVLVYIDDILIMSDSFEEHLDLVGKVLKILISNGIKIKLAKCSWFKEEIKFLGHVVSSKGVKKTMEYMEKVRNELKPNTVSEMRSFLGRVNFQRMFIPRCSELAQPLSAVTGGRKRDKIKWTPEMELAFEKLKEEAVKQVELAYPDYREEAELLELSVDASGFGAGACLAQKQNGTIKPIAFASMTFNDTQQRYSTTERELVALRWGVKTFRSYLYGVPFVIFTDHRPLLYLHNMKLVDSRLARTLEDLSDFSYEIRYKPGKENIIADGLSRIPEKLKEGSTDNYNPEWLPDGLRVFKIIPGGGDSLFISLWSILQHEVVEGSKPANHLELRKQLVDELLKEPARFGITLNKELKRDFKRMRSEGQLPSWELILVFSWKFKLQVLVHAGMSTPIRFNWGDEDKPTVHLQSLAGVHFNPVIDMKGNKNFLVYGITKEWRNSEFKDKNCDNTFIDGMVECENILEPGLESLFTEKEEKRCPCTYQCNDFLIWVGMAGVKYCCLLDTGAQISVMDENAWNSYLKTGGTYQLLRDKPETEIQGIGEGIEKILKVVLVPIQLPEVNTVHRIPMGIVKAGVIPYCVILGANFIKLAGIEFDFYRNEIRNNSGVILRYNKVGVFEIAWVQCWFVEEMEYKQEDRCSDVYWRVPRIASWDDMVQMQKRDYYIRKIRKIVVQNSWDQKKLGARLKIFKKYRERFIIEDDCLWFINQEVKVPVFTFKFMVDVLFNIHKQMAHVGREKLLMVTMKEGWHPEMERISREVSSTCEWCQRNKPQNQTRLPPTTRISSTVPFELVAMDLVSLPRSRRGNIGVFVVVDHFSKWLIVIPIKDKTSGTVAKELEERVLTSLPYKPEKVLTDNGPEFKAVSFREVLQRYGIQHIFTTPYRPQSNGAVERVNRTVIQLLRALQQNKDEWDVELPRMLMIYNGTYHSEIKMTPSERLVKEPNLPTTTVRISRDNRESVWKSGNPNFVKFQKGDKVLKRAEQKGNLSSNKFKERFTGPYKIVKAHHNGLTYELGNGDKIIRAHYSQLRCWREPPVYLKSKICGSCVDREESDAETEEQGVVYGCMVDDWVWKEDYSVKEPKKKLKKKDSKKLSSHEHSNIDKEQSIFNLKEELKEVLWNVSILEIRDNKRLNSNTRRELLEDQVGLNKLEIMEGNNEFGKISPIHFHEEITNQPGGSHIPVYLDWEEGGVQDWEMDNSLELNYIDSRRNEELHLLNKGYLTSSGSRKDQIRVESLNEGQGKSKFSENEYACSSDCGHLRKIVESVLEKTVGVIEDINSSIGNLESQLECQEKSEKESEINNVEIHSTCNKTSIEKRLEKIAEIKDSVAELRRISRERVIALKRRVSLGANDLTFKGFSPGMIEDGKMRKARLKTRMVEESIKVSENSENDNESQSSSRSISLSDETYVAPKSRILVNDQLGSRPTTRSQSRVKKISLAPRTGTKYFKGDIE